MTRALYIHWPFCLKKCPYCDFNSHVAARIDQTRWRDAYLREIDRLGAETKGRVLETVQVGPEGEAFVMLPDGSLAARKVGGFFDTWGMEDRPEWSFIGYMRYRSRRDLAILAWS